MNIPLALFKDEAEVPGLLESLFKNGGEAALDLLRQNGHDFTQPVTVKLQYMPWPRPESKE